MHSKWFLIIYYRAYSEDFDLNKALEDKDKERRHTTHYDKSVVKKWFKEIILKKLRYTILYINFWIKVVFK